MWLFSTSRCFLAYDIKEEAEAEAEKEEKEEEQKVEEGEKGYEAGAG